MKSKSSVKRVLIICSVVGCLFLLAGGTAYGQLITDSDTRLKTEKKKDKGGGLFFFLKKATNKSASEPQRQNVASAPRYSTGSPFASFNNRKATSGARSISASRTSMFAQYQNKVPRYSSGGIATMMSGQRNPVKYSVGDPFAPTIFEQIFKPGANFPRYSSGSPFGNSVSSVMPKYSQGSPFGNKVNMKTPKYSVGSPYVGMNWDWIKPKYTNLTDKERFYVNNLLKNTPRENFSDVEFSGFERKPKKWLARENSMAHADMIGGNIGQIKTPTQWRKKVNTYNKSDVIMSFEGRVKMPLYWPVESYDEAQYSGNFNYRTPKKWLARANSMAGADMISGNIGHIKAPTEWRKKLNVYQKSDALMSYEGPVKVPLYWPLESLNEAEYSGDFKQNWVKRSSMHPSAAHKNANQSSELIRESLRKWNILWTQVNRNKVQPDAVTDKITKPKFDRKEAEIWND